MLNKVQIIGNLGNEPEIRHTKSGETICTLSVATSESWKDKQTGEKKTATEWHKIVFFGGIAKVCEQWLHKGSKVYIEGSIYTKKWTDNNGQDKYSTEIKGREMKMLGDNSSKQAPQQSGNTGQLQQVNTKDSGFSPDNFNDDIPF
ncbi:MAG: single-stranded DNA-binding protein [Colwellia sp.]|nr:single-stranded DNA-binding protein [Colwellia sp.]